MVQHRLVLQDHKTDMTKIVTVSAAAVGTDLVQSEIDAAYVLAEAEAAVLRAKLNGRNRIERVALLPTSLTIFGAATMLGETPHEVAQPDPRRARSRRRAAAATSTSTAISSTRSEEPLTRNAKHSDLGTQPQP